MENNHPNPINFEDLSREELGAINKILFNLYRERGVDFRQYHHKCLRRRITVRMHSYKLNSFGAYLNVLKNTPSEYDRLLETIAINVSEFFRNPETFDAVRQKVIPKIIECKRKCNKNILRIWSAGCASGEEPYSIVLMLKEIFIDELADFTAIIYATDIDDDALKKAEKGVYGLNALKNLRSKQLEEYFVKGDKDTFMVKPVLKEMIRFKQHNLIEDKPPQQIDLVFCRNVVIYFNKALQRRVYEKFYQVLAHGGFLVAGKVETLLGVADHLFDRVDLAERIFKKKDDAKIDEIY